ncbi:MAG TPA: VWA domain-containing protein, partial [Bdellovibrionota bacterium]
MTDFQFASPTYLALLLALPALRILLGRMDQDAYTRLLRFLSEANLDQLLLTKGALRDKGKKWAFWLGLGFLVLALARPQANPSVEEVRSSGLDIYVLLDVSRSMDAEDVAPSRLKKAKRTIQHLTERLAGDRIGIIAFANSAILISPLTNDYSIIDSYLQNTDTSLVPSQGTNIGHALETAKEAMSRGAKAPGSDEERSNIFVVMSDGEDHGESDLSVADHIHKDGGLIFSIAFGTEKGVPIPVRDEKGELRGYKKDPAGTPVLTAVKTGVLQDVAKRGGGHFYFSTLDEGEVEDILARVNNGKRGAFTSIKTVVYDELFWIFLLPSLIFLLFSFLPLRSLASSLLSFVKAIKPRLSRKAKTATAALFFIFTCQGSAQAGPLSMFWDKERRASEESGELAREKKFSEAADALKELQAENPDGSEVNYNIGTYLLQDKKGRLGREQLSHLRNADGIVRDLAQFNTAGSFALEGKKPEARAAYAELLHRLQTKQKRSAQEDLLLEQARRNVARLADPNEQPPPQQDKSDSQQQQGSGGQDNKNQDDKKQQGGQGQGDSKDQKKDQENKGDQGKQPENDKKDDKKNEGQGEDQKKDESKTDQDKNKEDQGDKEKQEG